MNKSTNKEKGTHFSKYSETKNAFILYQEDPVYVILREHLNIKPSAITQNRPMSIT